MFSSLAVGLWLVSLVYTAVVILVDRARRRAAAARSDEPSSVMFEESSVLPYLGLSLITGILPLPVYFCVTRKNVFGLVIGLGWFAIGVFLLVPIAVGATWLDRRSVRNDAMHDCETAAHGCTGAADALLNGAKPGQADVPRAIGLLERGCEGGDPEACMRLGGIYNAGEVVPVNFKRGTQYSERVEPLCAKNPGASYICGMYAATAAEKPVGTPAVPDASAHPKIATTPAPPGISELSVKGELAEDVVMRVLQGRLPALNTCLSPPIKNGSMYLALDIHSDGSAQGTQSGSRASDTSYGDVAMMCLLDAAGKIRFPKAASPTSVSFVVARAAPAK